MELTAHGCTMGLSAYRATVILLFFFLSHFSFTTAIRKDIGFKFTPFCKTTVQGRYLLSDNNGYVCNALSIDSKSRCCPQTGKKFSLDAIFFHSVAILMNIVFLAVSIPH
ncbi:hypothetical protein KIW84_043945 [Lathyrus oleraceus]|uniref:SREBP regulating gene protein n=1 Tax=Pisum sativum TaxID=3888 RepID=A0A9D4XGW7_PEA|nr:hypothetical protein KIW84_043945 [Pisum sativum]